jgi:HD superfamily phosphohydrolase/serine/threonine protein kinase
MAVFDARTTGDIEQLLSSLTREDSPKDALITPEGRFARTRDMVSLDGLPPLEFRKGGVILPGGGGVVFECHHRDLGRRYALKLPRPSLLSEDAEAAQNEMALNNLEVVRTAALGHRNVISLIGLTRIPSPMLGTSHLAVSLLEWIEDATPLSEAIYRRGSLRSLINTLQQVAAGLSHIHSRGLVHWDFKSDNCLVASDETVKIVDIGNARELKASDSLYESKVQVFTSRENISSAIAGRGPGPADGSDSRRIPLSFQPGDQSHDRPWIDLYMFGMVLARLLGRGTEQTEELTEMRRDFLARVFPPGDDDAEYAHRFLSAVADRLCRFGESPRRPGLRVPETEAFYVSASQIADDIGKLLPEFGAAANVSELRAVPQHVIRAPITRNTPLSRRVSRLVNSRPVSRLNRHLQLGLTKVAFPGAVHTRFEHVIGVLHVTTAYVRALYADRTSPIFRLVMNEADITALLFAAVVHDCGHGAFSHYLEEWPALFADCAHEDYAQEALRGEERWYSAHVDTVTRDRESLLAAAQDWCREEQNPSDFLHEVAEILHPTTDPISASFDTPIGVRAAKTHILHSILDSSMDADKLDYLRRDAVHAEVDYGKGIDIDRLFQSLTVATERPTTGGEDELVFAPTVAITPKGVLPLESFLQARYQMFNALYWQHTARGATAVIQYLVWRALIPSTGRPSRIKFNRRRADLLEEFRVKDDRAALDSLEASLTAGRMSASRRIRLTRLIDAVRTESDFDGRDLPQSICDLAYPGMSGSTDHDRYSLILENHETLSTISDPLEYSRARTRLIEEFISRLRQMLGEAGELISIPVDEMSVFIDVPLGSKDQIENLFVVEPNHVSFFSAYSPLADATRDAFRQWSRRVRVFAMPDVAEQLLRAAGGEIVLRQLAFAALFEAYEAEVRPLTARRPLLPIEPFEDRARAMSVNEASAIAD